MPAAKTSDLDKTLQLIALGRLDDGVVAISEALAGRANEAGLLFRWTISIDGLEIAEDDLTFDALDLIKARTGKLWHELTVDALTDDHATIRAILEAVLIARDGVSSADAVKRVGGFKTSQVVKGLRVEQVDPQKAGTSV